MKILLIISIILWTATTIFVFNSHYTFEKDECDSKTVRTKCLDKVLDKALGEK